MFLKNDRFKPKQEINIIHDTSITIALTDVAYIIYIVYMALIF